MFRLRFSICLLRESLDGDFYRHSLDTETGPHYNNYSIEPLSETSQYVKNLAEEIYRLRENKQKINLESAGRDEQVSRRI